MSIAFCVLRYSLCVGSVRNAPRTTHHGRPEAGLC